MKSNYSKESECFLDEVTEEVIVFLSFYTDGYLPLKFGPPRIKIKTTGSCDLIWRFLN